jgi:hypothetical protein
MTRSPQRSSRPVPPLAQSEPEYPDLRQHLATRRDVLTFVGASLVTGALSACLQGKLPNPNYRTSRLPETGELEISLASGETCRFYVNAVYYGELVEDLTPALLACIDVLRDFTASELATSDGRSDVHHALAAALGPLFPNFSLATLTIIEP